jgi:hypothetical protein
VYINTKYTESKLSFCPPDRRKAPAGLHEVVVKLDTDPFRQVTLARCPDPSEEIFGRATLESARDCTEVHQSARFQQCCGTGSEAMSREVLKA